MKGWHLGPAGAVGTTIDVAGTRAGPTDTMNAAAAINATLTTGATATPGNTGATSTTCDTFTTIPTGSTGATANAVTAIATGATDTKNIVTKEKDKSQDNQVNIILPSLMINLDKELHRNLLDNQFRLGVYIHILLLQYSLDLTKLNDDDNNLVVGITNISK